MLLRLADEVSCQVGSETTFRGRGFRELCWKARTLGSGIRISVRYEKRLELFIGLWGKGLPAIKLVLTMSMATK